MTWACMDRHRCGHVSGCVGQGVGEEVKFMENERTRFILDRSRAERMAVKWKRGGEECE